MPTATAQCHPYSLQYPQRSCPVEEEIQSCVPMAIDLPHHALRLFFPLCDPLSKSPAFPQILISGFRRFCLYRSAKLRLLHRVTGGLHCIILEYEAWFCYYKDDTSLNSLAGSVKYMNVLLWTAWYAFCILLIHSFRSFLNKLSSQVGS